MMYKNIVLHWTAGAYYPCNIDLRAYHYVVDKDGITHKGLYKPSDNLNCKDGKYAAHCGGGNTGRIGIAICCKRDGNTPPTKLQIEALCHLAASLCITYGLQPNECITHAEFGITHQYTSSFGKVDINEIPYTNLKGIKECGDYLRNKINWYYLKLKEVK